MLGLVLCSLNRLGCSKIKLRVTMPACFLMALEKRMVLCQRREVETSRS